MQVTRVFVTPYVYYRSWSVSLVQARLQTCIVTHRFCEAPGIIVQLFYNSVCLTQCWWMSQLSEFQAVTFMNCFRTEACQHLQHTAAAVSLHARCYPAVCFGVNCLGDSVSSCAAGAMMLNSHSMRQALRSCTASQASQCCGSSSTWLRMTIDLASSLHRPKSWWPLLQTSSSTSAQPRPEGIYRDQSTSHLWSLRSLRASISWLASQCPVHSAHATEDRRRFPAVVAAWRDKG
jgi:hypothetical protein